MAFSIVTNAASLLAQDNLRITSDLQQKTIQRLTSGLRINSSADDAAGLAIANSFRSDVSVLQQGVRNANDGLSTLQTIDGGINNISLLLDRARTLATQSASGTFTGDRNVLNSEFGSVLGEIDRQAQSIGLDPGGTFAKLLSVFIGGGRAHTGQATQVAINNGSVTIDLSSSTVATKSLGLAGLQALGGTAGTTDLSSASTTSVANILANGTNTASEANSGFTTFNFSGPGFSDSSKIGASVNLTGVTDANTLVSAINSAIAAAGNGTTAAATAFKNANITASVNTDSTGKQQIAFNSGSVAFQVQAGDLVSNALLGNFASGSTGATLATTVTGSAVTPSAVTTAAGAETVDLRVQGGGLTTPVDLTVNIANLATVGGILSALQTQVNGNSTLKNAGITLSTATAGGALVFSDAQGQKFSVGASGDTQNLLGLGTFLPGASSAFDYSTITSATAFAAVGTPNSGADTFEFSLNGAASSVTAGKVTGSVAEAGPFVTNGVPFTTTSLLLNIDGTAVTVDFTKDPNKGGAETQAQVAGYINSTVRQALGLGSNVTVAAFNVGNDLVLTSPTTGANSSVTVTDNATSVALGLTTGAGNVTNAGTGSDGFTINLAGGTATATNVTGAALASTVDTTAATMSGSRILNFTVDGAAVAANFASDANSATNETLAQIAAFLNTTAQKALDTSANVVTLDGSGTKLVITSPTTGKSSTAVVTDGGAASASEVLKLTGGTGATTTSGAAPTGNDIANRINQAIGANSALAAAALQASYSSATDKFTIASSTGTFFQLSSRGTAAGSDIGFGATGATFAGNAASAAPTTSPVIDAGGSNVSSQLTYGGISLGNGNQTVTLSAIDSTGAEQALAVVLQNNGTARNSQNLDDAIHAINAALQQSNIPVLQGIVAVKDDSSGTEKIRFLSGSSPFRVNIGTNVDGSGVAPQGTTNNSSVSSGGSTATIATQTNAATAVTLLSTAVSLLGAAQAVVGRGENQLQFAIGLASTQTDNLSIAQGRIRDADLAAEAANLTRASIGLQAGVAALAQANSAPQAVLALLRG
ncbi:MAG TPA: flagellin [Bryobacterales bacterium]|nr:flagellin [Bryobacterales bacterium]